MNYLSHAKLKATETDPVILAICSDCLLFLANGDLPPENTEEQDRQYLDRLAKHSKGFFNISPTCSGDPSFSWTPCETCGSRLGGDRHDANALIETIEGAD